MAKVESFGWIIYYMKDNQPYFLVIKRQALSKRIEWTAPKWKKEEWESPIQTAKREIFEETWIKEEDLIEKWFLWNFNISFPDTNYLKQVTYFLFEFKWEPNSLKIADTEWYVGVFNWLKIDSILNLISYKWLRELYRKAYVKINNDLKHK